MQVKRRIVRCQCIDPGCLSCQGKCAVHGNLERVYRIDMDDRKGMAFCSGCAEDAMKSGVFSCRPPWKREES